ncbi:MAG: hypothetical protein WDM79_16575 [Terricaulis sp.]
MSPRSAPRLEAVMEADLLIHVRDIAASRIRHTQARRRDGGHRGMLAKDRDDKRPPILEAWNKIDLLDAETHDARMRRALALDGGPSRPGRDLRRPRGRG